VKVEEIERRLRQPHPLERAYPGSRRRTRTVHRSRVGGIAPLLVPLVVVLVVTAFAQLNGRVGEGPQASPGIDQPEPSKPFVSIPPETAPPVTAAACAPGAVKGSFLGSGGAMGTQYVIVRLAAVGRTCSLPRTPDVALTDNAGTALAVSTQGGSSIARIDLATVLEARVAVFSLCESPSSRPLFVALHLGNGNDVRVPLPDNFTQDCVGGQTQVAVDGLFAAP
jgi:uncharacterized protein DUF4232